MPKRVTYKRAEDLIDTGVVDDDLDAVDCLVEQFFLTRQRPMTERPVNRRRLFNDLGFPGQKIPADTHFVRENVPLYDNYGVLIGRFTVAVRESCYRDHRVFVKCPRCEQWVPFGRLAQHYRKADGKHG